VRLRIELGRSELRGRSRRAPARVEDPSSALAATLAETTKSWRGSEPSEPREL